MRNKLSFLRMMLASIPLLLVMSCGDDDPDNPPPKGELLVLGLFDLTGGTGDVGPSYSRGVLDLLDKTNQEGGVGGYQVKIDWIDYAYVAKTATDKYEKWKTDGVMSQAVTIFGWGTSDSVTLRPEVCKDQMPYVSASYAESLGNPGGTPPDCTKDAPYNFFAGTDYSQGIRVGVGYMANKGGAKKIAFAYCSAGYCAEPIPAGKAYAGELGKTVKDDLKFYSCDANDTTKCDYAAIRAEPVAPATTGKPKADAKIRYEFAPNNLALAMGETADAKNYVTGIELADSEEVIDAKVKAYFEYKAAGATVQANMDVDWIWIGNTSKTAAFFTKAVAKHGPGPTKIMSNVWGFDEGSYSKCPEACPDRLFGTLPFTAFGDTSASIMTKVLALHTEYRGKGDKACVGTACACLGADGQPDPSACRDVHYIQGYVSYMIWAEAIKQLSAEGATITGPAIKAKLETFNNFDTGGLTAPLTFKPNDHRPQATELIYMVKKPDPAVPGDSTLKYIETLNAPPLKAF